MKPMQSLRCKRARRFALAVVASAAMTVPALAADLRSAGPLEFGPDGVLFVGDSLGGKVVALELGPDQLDDQTDYRLGRAETFEGRTIVSEIDRVLGTLVGASPERININDLAVHLETKQIFISAHRGLGPDAMPFIAKVDHGEIALMDVAAIPSTSLALNNPAETGELEFGQPIATYAVTDIDYHNGEIFVAGVSGETFDSTLRRAAYPFEGEIAETKIEIWHAVHAQFETRAPIITQTIAELDGEPTLIAVYACTPLVRIPLSQLRDGAEIRGEMIGELGYGNTPIDIVRFSNPMDGSDNVLVTNTNRSAKQVALADIASAEPMPVNVANNFGPAGVNQFPIPAADVEHLALVDEQWAVAIRSNPDDPNDLQLHTLPVPFFFDRADHVVEMNFPDAPDPFGYRQHPPLDL